MRRQLGAARVPCGAEAAAERAGRGGQARHLGRVAVAAHQAEAGDRIAVAFEQLREDGGRERFADLLLQLGLWHPGQRLGQPAMFTASVTSSGISWNTTS